MNIRTVFNILSALLVILGVSMLIPAAIAYGYGETISMVFCGRCLSVLY